MYPHTRSLTFLFQFLENMILGIDIGTTSVKVAFCEHGKIVHEEFKAHKSYVNMPDAKFKEQDVSIILSCLTEILESVPSCFRENVSKISICGQMHGVCLWNERDKLVFEEIWDTRVNVRLITWEDGRCSPEFLATLPNSNFGPIYSGFGMSTLCWLQENKQKELMSYEYCGSVMDYISWALCQSEVVMGDQIAFSWGYFDPTTCNWEKALLLPRFDVVVPLLPEVKRTGECAGVLKNSWVSIPKGTSVNVSTGDFQCAVLAAEIGVNAPNHRNMVLNLGTSCQLGYTNIRNSTSLNCQNLWPYFSAQSVLVNASLNGGNVLSHCISQVTDFVKSIGFTNLEEKDVWDLVGSLKFNSNPGFEYNGALFGERNAPNGKVVLCNITPSCHFNLTNLLSAVVIGLLKNVLKMTPNDYEISSHSRLLCIGSIFRNQLIQDAVKHVFACRTIDFMDNCSSARGAAFSCIKH